MKRETIFMALFMTLALGTIACGEDAEDPAGDNNAVNNDAPNNDAPNNAPNNDAPNNDIANNDVPNNTPNNDPNNAPNNDLPNNDPNNDILTCAADNECPPGNRCVEGTCQAPVIIESCEDANATACFSNLDCPDDMRCENIGTDFEVPCCVTGARGAGAYGDVCTAAEDCAVGVCIEGDAFQGCSQECEGDDDCTNAQMPRCINLAGIGGWCFPPN